MSRKPRIDKAVYNIPEIAAQMDINIPKAYELARQPGFPSIRIGRRIVVPKEAFHSLLLLRVACSRRGSSLRIH